MTYLPGCLFFVAGAVLLMTEDLNVINALAFTGCASCAGLSVRRPLWAFSGGALLILTSVGMQVFLDHHCMFCLRTDFLILGGVICISIVTEGVWKRWVLVMAVVLALLITFESSVFGTLVLSEADAAGTYNFERFLEVYDTNGALKLDTKEKTAVIFSNSCNYCEKTLEKLIQFDPRGDKWVPVETKSWPGEGGDKLKKYGYRGDFYFTYYSGPVPLYITTSKETGRTTANHDIDMLIKLIGNYVHTGN